jgi:molecular chaperone GrpE
MREDRTAGEERTASPDADIDIVEVEAPAPDDVAESAGVPAEDQIQTELARLQKEAGLLREQYLRKLADFDNFRKRKDKEMSDFRKQANADLLRELLPVVDNLERALAAAGDDPGGVRTGVELTLKQFRDVLARHGIVELNPEGQPFDPSEHEAVTRLHAEGVEANTVVQVLQKGYRLGDRLLRAALVIVAAPPPAAGTGEGA